MAKGRKNLFDGILYLLNNIAALALLLSYLAYYISPNLTTFFSFLALSYPALLFINLLFVLYWLIRLKRKILLSIICIAVGYLHVSRSVQFSSAHKAMAQGNSLKVMSFNLRFQNQYEWIEGKDVPKKILELIELENPDVLMVQEYRTKWPEAAIDLGFKYAHYKLNQAGTRGQAIFSRYPIGESKIIPFEADSASNKDFHWADIKFRNKTIRFINVHLASVGLENEDYKLLENPDANDQEKLERGIRSIAKSLNAAFKRRANQIRSVVKAVNNSPYPVILAGDFNDVPQSYVYHQVDLQLEDSFMESGGGLGKTYIKSPLPLRIDYIFHSKEFRAFNFQVINKELSDHYPIVTELEFVN